MNYTVGIIGAGPAGCTLACFLQEKKIDCVVFDDGKTPDLIVGESLVSAIIPVLRRLGIEQRVAEISQIKHGAALRHKNGTRVDFRFQAFGKNYPDYAYNVLRPDFDNILKARAKELGVKFISHRAELELCSASDDKEIQLNQNSLKSAGLTRETQPDLLVDATGRCRLFSKFLNLSYQKGKRNDVSYFAHYHNFKHDSLMDGQVVLSVLDCGWSWQIPHKNSLSVGVVLDKNFARHYGKSSEDRLEKIISTNPIIANNGKDRQRISSVKSYSNYQLLSNQGYGKGWVLLGDAFGFVDPMLSPGLHMALESAVLLEKHVLSKTSPKENDFELYSRKFKDWHQAWNYLVEYFYDGRILSMGAARNNIHENPNFLYLPRLIEPYVSRVLSSLVTGIKTRSKFNQQILWHSSQSISKQNNNVNAYAIQSTLPDIEFESIKKTNDLPKIA